MFMMQIIYIWRQTVLLVVHKTTCDSADVLWKEKRRWNIFEIRNVLFRLWCMFVRACITCQSEVFIDVGASAIFICVRVWACKRSGGFALDGFDAFPVVWHLISAYASCIWWVCETFAGAGLCSLMHLDPECLPLIHSFSWVGECRVIWFLVDFTQIN